MKSSGRIGLLLLALTAMGSAWLLPLQSVQAAQSAYRELDWIDLLPADDLASLEDRPEILDTIEEGSGTDAASISALMEGQKGKLSAKEMAHLQRYQAALQSVQTRSDVLNQPVKVPGFVVPLEYDDKQRITELFLVPFFGACIHVPPPPPNQIIHVRLNKPVQLESLYDPVWLEGSLSAGNTTTELGQSAYEMDVKALKPFE